MADDNDLRNQWDRTLDAARPSPFAGDLYERAKDADALPRRIGRYDVKSLLGTGAMGSVYLGFDTQLNRHVALKTLSGSASTNADAKERFVREAQAAAALNHPGICTIHSIEKENGVVFLVLEYVRGNSFRQLIDTPASGWPPKPETAASYILQAADALRAAHASGIVHRDIKSSNLMRTLDDRVKILDFGLAKMSGLNLLTQDGSIVGTPAYVSPEQARGESVDVRSDLWSLGVVFYEVLTGRLPFPDTSIASLAHSILNREPTPLRQLRPDLPAPYSWVIQKLLAKNRDQRYPTAAALIAEMAPLADRGWSERSSRDLASMAAAATSSRAGMDSLLGTSERRAVTFLHVELVSSLGHKEPEDFEATLDKARDLCARVIYRHEGYILPWVGSTVNICFGFPRAREGAARLAVDAGFALGEEFAKSDMGFHFRGGVESALVIADTSLAKPLSGEGFELARALCNLAEPNQLLIGEETRRQLHGQFQFSDERSFLMPGGRQLRYSNPKPSSGVRGRFHAVKPAELTPLLGRDQEMEILARHWESAVEGHGNIVLLGGAAGLGKSRLTYELKRRVQQGFEATVIECFCSPLYANTELHPITDCCERTLFESDAKAMDQSEKILLLESFLSEMGFDLHDTMPLLAALLGMDLPSSPRLEVTPERQRALTLEALVNLLVELAAKRPVLLILEDLHWADPTTLQLLGMLVDQLAALPVMVLCTHRPEYIPSLPPRSHVSVVSLNRLSRNDSLQMISAASRQITLDSGTREQIIGNSDGVPLFLEEMTRTVVETGGRTKTHKLPVPATLRDSFDARLDQLGTARNVARVAAVLGREFPEVLLEAVSELPSEELRENLDRLVNAEILYLRGSGKRRTFIFKHALLQEAAYDSLLKKSRLELHARAGQLLINQFQSIVSRHPEIVARHFSEAGLGAQAIPYWHQAGLAALLRSAYQEAISQFENGLEAYRSIPETQREPAQELLLLTSLGPALLATLGFGAERVGETYRQAEQLIRTDSASPLVLSALWGIWVYSLVRSYLDHALATALKMVDTGNRMSDDAMRLEGHWTAGNTLYWKCDLLQAKSNLESAESIYDVARFDEHAYRFGQDTLVATLCYLSFVYCFLGLFDLAMDASERCIARAKALRHPFSIGWSLTFRATLDCFTGNYEEARDMGDHAVTYCQDQSYPFWISAALAASGRSLGALGFLEEGIGRLQQGIAMTRAIGSRVIEPLYRGQLAELLMLKGDYEAALAEAENGIDQANEQGVIVSRLDLLRIRGLAFYKLGGTSEAENSLWQSLEESRAAECRLIELRAAADLAELFGQFEPLNRVLIHFPEKVNEAPVLRHARQLTRRN